MKQAILLLGVVIILLSCGRRNNSSDRQCRSRESMKLECQVVNTPNYGRPYAQEMCNRTYTTDKCY
jgi:hypothetical protein